MVESSYNDRKRLIELLSRHAQVQINDPNNLQHEEDFIKLTQTLDLIEKLNNGEEFKLVTPNGNIGFFYQSIDLMGFFRIPTDTVLTIKEIHIKHIPDENDLKLKNLHQQRLTVLLKELAKFKEK